MFILRNLRAVSNRLRGKLHSVAVEHRQRSKARFVRRYLDTIVQANPDVLIAANFLSLGGIRQHMLSIQRFSSLVAEVIPSDSFLERVSRHEVETRFSNSFMQVCIPSLLAVHTHVFPWCIHWGKQRQAMGNKWIHTYHLLYTTDHASGQMPTWQKEFNAAQLDVGRHADLCLSVSKWQRRALESEYGISSMYLPNGVNVASCDQASEDRFSSEYSIHQPFALYIGRDDPVKNPAEFAQVAKKMPELQFVMVGRGLDRQYLESNYGVPTPENLVFLPQVSHTTALDAIAACSVLVVTSKREGLPTLILEAMTQSKPVVAGREPGCIEVLGDGDYGYLYELGDIADLKTKIQLALVDRNKPRLARKRVLDHYDWRVVAKQLDRIYQDRS